MEHQPYTSTLNSQGCSRYLKGCAVIVALSCIALVGLLIYLSGRPNIKSLVTCRENIPAIGEALRRYHDANDTYPRALSDLKAEYLSDPSVLSCPEDKALGDNSYTYHRPPAGASGDFVVIECARHRLYEDAPLTVFKLRLDGKVRAEPLQPSPPPKR